MQFAQNKPAKVYTKNRFELDACPGSPMKNRRRNLDFSHFQTRYRQKLSDSEIMAIKLNLDSSLAAATLSDGSL